MLKIHRRLACQVVVMFSLCVPLCPSVLAQTPFSLKVTTDREDALYEVGQKATFSISVWQGEQIVSGEGKVKFAFDDFLNSNGFSSGEGAPGEQPTRVTEGLKQPGFLRCLVTYTPREGKPLRAIAAAAFSPQKIGLSLPVPDDFDDFWAEQKRQLAEIPLEPELTSVDQSDASIECHDVQVPCSGGAPVSGYFARPKVAAAKSLPAILWVHGAGVRGSSLSNAAKGAKAGMLSMDINAHGIANGKPASFYAQQSAGPLKNYRYAGRESRDTSYFRGMYLRIVRAIDFLTAQPEWDGKHVVVIGHSQGGGQSLVAGGIDERVTMIAPGVPAICDHSGQAAGRINGWPKLVPNGADGKPDPQILQASRYVDAVNFATRCNADAIMSVGFIDSVCPPSSCYAAYNVLTGSKSVINEPLMGHAAPAHIQEAFFARVLQHVGRKSAELAK
ncbi:MAG: acetylxylan esterase [Fuerstiella sp.]|nr:acetylxylan esterase [Fuerstiella sp.]MCP4853742.1 acetylxylan esterase [Fuerstiella sp.]